MLSIKFEARAVGAGTGAASRYGSIFTEIIRLPFRNTGLKYTFSKNLLSSLQCCRSGSGRIRTFLVGSGRLGPDPDLGLNK
jgi:hypothetical protein